MPVQTLIKYRRDTAANWTSANPTLSAGEAGLETDSGLVKYGNGTTAWVDLPYTTASSIRTRVKNSSGSTISKGSVVYISGANGDNALISLADADLESTSSKTLGIVVADIANDGFGYVIESGEIKNVNTGSATAGQSVWLSSTAGQFVFGAPPAKPAHSVYLGVVTRAHSNNGAILVKVQNGYELDELHDVNIGTKADNNLLVWDDASQMWTNQTAAQAGLATATHSHAIGDVTDLQTTLDAKAPLSSPALTGTPTAPTATAGTNTTQVATTAFVATAVANVIDSAPGALDTLNELAAALGDDANFAATVTTSLSEKAPLASPALTGVPTAPTAAVDTNTTQLATTEYVIGQGYLKSADAASTYSVNGHTHTAGQVTPTVTDFSTNTTINSSSFGNRIYRCTSSTGVTVTINNVLTNGHRIDFIQGGTGQITFAAGAGVTILSVDGKLKTNKQYSGATIMRAGTGYYLVGDIVA